MTGYGDGRSNGELIRTSPDNEEYAQAVLQVLTRRLEALDGDYVVLSERAVRPPAGPRPQPGFLERLQTQGARHPRTDHP